jgi:hypothetical protein
MIGGTRRAALAARVFVLLALAAGLSAPTQPARAQRAPAEPAAMQAQRLQPGERLRLDGTLSHPAWQRAPVHLQFVEKSPDTGAVPQHATRVRVLFDEQALYVGIEALDAQPGLIRAPLVKHDGVNRTQDFVVVYLDAIGSRQSAQFFRVNAAGSTADGMHTAADDSEDFSPDFDFDAATAQQPDGWTAVLRIPFASLRFASHPEGTAQPWRILVGRRVPREQFFLHTSALVPRDAPSFIATMQPLEGVQLPERHQFLTLRPSLTWRARRQQAAGEAVRSTHEAEASLDLKWRPVHELVVDATLNPDFSQVALDVPQLAGNTRFALSFPETRPFFFESSDLLRSPTEALYTRSFTQPRWGLRGTWRGSALAGSAFAIDDRGGGLVLLPAAFGTEVAEQPASRAGVARVRGDAGALQWGALAAQRHYDGGRGHNQVAGPDLAWQIDGAWRLRAQWLQSHTTAQPLAGELVLGEATRGHLAHARLLYQGDRREADFSTEDVAAGFRDDTGFVAQSGVRRVKGRAALGWAGLGPFNEVWVNLEGERVRSRDSGELVSQDLSPGLWVTGAHNLEAWAYLHGLWRGSAALRPAAGAPLLHQRYLKAYAVFTPGTWAPLLSAELQWGRLADVSAQQVRPGGKLSLSINTRLLPRLELEPSLTHAWLRQDGRTVYAESAHQLLARWHFTPHQALRAIVQYTSLERQAEAARNGLPALPLQRSQGTTGSLTWAWRRSAGTVLYLGAARSRRGVSAISHGNEAFIKLQVDADELRRGW